MVISTTARPDLDTLLNVLISYAQQTLDKRGEFYPFGAFIRPEGEIACISADSVTEHPLSEEVIDLLEQSLRQEAASGSIRAAGIVYDARVMPPGASAMTEAIAVRLQHESDAAVEIFLPYRRNLLGKVKYGKLFATDSSFSVFLSTDDVR